MVWVELYDDSNNAVELENGAITHLPDEVSMIKTSSFNFDGAAVNLDYIVLTSLLRGLSRKLQSIVINEQSTMPVDVAFLTSAIKSTDRLEIHMMNNQESPVFCSRLMNGFMRLDGPKQLLLSANRDISTDEANLLFRGVANSACLESLEMGILNFQDEEAATRLFVDALNQNRSLKTLDFDSVGFSNKEEIFRAAILSTKVRSFKWDNTSSRDFGFVWDVLGSEDCELQSLTLLNLDMGGTGDLDANRTTPINTSVKEACLDLESFEQLKGICDSFKSAEKLELNVGECNNNLSPLDTLLIGDDLELKHLTLNLFDVSENSIIQFFRKLPQMTCIRSIKLGASLCEWNPEFLDSNEWIDVLSREIQNNTSLERLRFDSWNENWTQQRIQIEAALALNNAKNQFTMEAEFPSNRWPLVLERATRVSYFACPNAETHTNLGSDVVFWLLREKMVGAVTFTP